jgi:hypothetical protein
MSTPNRWGIFAQNLEGQILKDVMLETWQQHLDGVRTKVKIDLRKLAPLTVLVPNDTVMSGGP